MEHIIKVSIQLPLVTNPRADNYLDPSNWFWMTCLVIPKETLFQLQLSYYPYRWIRYAVGAVVGAQGDLFSSEHALHTHTIKYGDKLEDLSEQSEHLYYHINNEEKQQMFPLDPHINNTKITSDVGARRASNFRDQVESRDRGRCVLTGERNKRGCEAAHLIPHSKGNQYICNFIERRSRDISDCNIDSIDHVRNGLFLNSIAHKFMGDHLAFLPTPNFAMENEDVHPNSCCGLGAQNYTAHIFAPGCLDSLHGDLHGTSFQMARSQNRPSIALLDAVYASTVLHHFGTREYNDAFSSTWSSNYYPNSIMTSGQSSYNIILQRRVLENATAEKQKRERERREACRQNRQS